MKTTTVGILFAAAAWTVFASGCGSGPGETQAAGETEESVGAIRLGPEGEAAAGLKTSRAERRSWAAPIDAYGQVRFDPRFRHHLTARVPGRIEEILAFEGARVAAGRTLLTMYSPEFLSAQSELLLLLERREAAERSGGPQERSLAQAMLTAAEKKIALLGLGPEDIQGLEARHETALLLAVRAPIGGVVIDCPVLAGSSVEAGTLLADIADPSKVQVEARVFERDIARLESGLETVLTLAALPGETFRGRLATIGAALDDSTRMVKAVIDVSNPAGRLRPGMSAAARIVPRRTVEVLAVPESAVRRVEGRDLVFVVGPGRTFVPTEVTVGRTLEGFVEIVSGLDEGREVAIEGSLALKSELLKKNLEGD